MAFFRSKKPSSRSVHCPHCGAVQEIPSSALSCVCPKCNRSMQIEDRCISNYSATTEFSTCGSLAVEKKGTIIVQKKVVAATLSLQGALKGDAIVFESAKISSGGQLKGRLKARTLVVEEGATLEGYFEITPNIEHLSVDSPAPGAAAS